MTIFKVNTNRFDPYKNYLFLVFFGTNTNAVAAVSKVTALKRSSTPIDYNEGGYAITLKGLGRTKYEPITLERGITFDMDFEEWANAAQILKSGAPSTSLANLRKEIRIVLLNEAASTFPRTRCTRPGARNTRRCPIWTRARTAWRSSTSSSRTRDGNATPA